MMSFKDYCEQVQHAKPWKAGKDEILQMWGNLRPSPILMRPVPQHQKGSRFHHDGIRLTGSPMFINSVLSRLKDIMAYERNPGQRLDLEYREIQAGTGGPESGYVCYIHVEQDINKRKKINNQLAT
jgi:hypothetical protein